MPFSLWVLVAFWPRPYQPSSVKAFGISSSSDSLPSGRLRVSWGLHVVSLSVVCFALCLVLPQAWGCLPSGDRRGRPVTLGLHRGCALPIVNTTKPVYYKFLCSIQQDVLPLWQFYCFSKFWGMGFSCSQPGVGHSLAMLFLYFCSSILISLFIIVVTLLS